MASRLGCYLLEKKLYSAAELSSTSIMDKQFSTKTESDQEDWIHDKMHCESVNDVVARGICDSWSLTRHRKENC